MHVGRDAELRREFTHARGLFLASVVTEGEVDYDGAGDGEAHDAEDGFGVWSFTAAAA